MVDDSINMAKDVERFYKQGEWTHEDSVQAFVKAAQGDLSAPAPFNYGHKGATVCDMMQHSLNTKVGVTLATVFAYLAESAKEDEKASAILEAMADQFIWIAR